jgi:hypothetical protein
MWQLIKPTYATKHSALLLDSAHQQICFLGQLVGLKEIARFHGILRLSNEHPGIIQGLSAGAGKTQPAQVVNPPANIALEATNPALHGVLLLNAASWLELR